jgi:tetratricopeptide (TPR) repeat protein
MLRYPLILLAPALALATCCPAAPARASDFWDAVRTPGLGAHRRALDGSREALRSGHHEKSLELAERAIEILPDRAGGHVLRGRALGRLSRLPDAMAAFERALQLDPAALDDVNDGADAAYLTSRFARYRLSARILERVLGRMEESSSRNKLFALYGDLLQAMGPGRLRAAMVAYRSSLRGSGEDNDRARLGLALALHRQGRVEEAIGRATLLLMASRVDRLIRSLSLPPAERAARAALVREAMSDREAARYWEAAADGEGPWQDHAREAARRVANRPLKGRGERR